MSTGETVRLAVGILLIIAAHWLGPLWARYSIFPVGPKSTLQNVMAQLGTVLFGGMLIFSALVS